MFSKRKDPPRPMQVHRPRTVVTKAMLDLKRRRQRIQAKVKEDETIDVMRWIDDYQEIVWCIFLALSTLFVFVLTLIIPPPIGS